MNGDRLFKIVIMELTADNLKLEDELKKINLEIKEKNVEIVNFEKQINALRFDQTENNPSKLEMYKPATA